MGIVTLKVEVYDNRTLKKQESLRVLLFGPQSTYFLLSDCDQLN